MEAKRVTITEPALADLTAIHEYIASDNPEAADRFIGDLVSQIYKLAELAIPGSPRDWVRPGLRMFPYKQRCIYFRSYPDHIVVVRVLHGKQDVLQQEFTDA